MNNKYSQILFIDFETYYSRDFSLSKMPTILYVRDEQFKVFGAAVALDDAPSKYLEAEELADYLGEVDWANTAICAHNAQFDGCVLTQHYGYFPAYYICSQSVARALLPIDSVALKNVAPLLGLGEKGNALVEGAKAASAGMAAYAVQDNELARGIYQMLYPMLSQNEQDLIHLTVKMSVEPVLELDKAVLQQVYNDAKTNREALIAASGYTEDQLASNQKFLSILTGLGLTAPMKISKTTGEEATAFSKGDDAFIEFMIIYPEYEHIWKARMASKSMINITRAETFLAIAKTGTLPMPLSYCGAKTGRWSGIDKLNVQNLPSKYKSNLRTAIRAPKGQVVVVADSSQIELRATMWFCGQEDKKAILDNNGDVYKAEAASQFNIPVEEVTKNQRSYGKLIQLACMYGQGATLFRKNAAAGPLGMSPIYMTPEEAYIMITNYRANNSAIPAMWRKLDARINQMTLPGLNEEDGVLTFVHEGIILPSGRMLQYPGLHQTEEGQWVYGIDKKIAFLWGGTLLNNCIQALARDIVAEQMLEIAKRYRVVSSTHDEIIYLANEDEAEKALAFGLKTMSTSPAWAPDLIVNAEGGYDVCYSK